MNTYFERFGLGWLAVGAMFVFVWIFMMWVLAASSDTLMGLVYVLAPLLFGFLGLKRFSLWTLSWAVLFFLNVISDQLQGAGSGGGEYLGPVMLLALPVFVFIGIVDEIRYAIKSRKAQALSNNQPNL